MKSAENLCEDKYFRDFYSVANSQFEGKEEEEKFIDHEPHYYA